MIIAGCDLGSATGKVVIMKDDTILSWSVVQATNKPEITAKLAMEEALRKTELSSVDDIKYIVGTGYGRSGVSFINDNISEISCHGYGAHWLCPEARTVVDIGGQDSKVISLDDSGKVLEFTMNNKCAAGTGRFFETMVRVLCCSFEELSSHSLESKTPATITSQCSVFAESEVVTLINNGVAISDIAAGIHNSIARRIYSMINKVGLNPNVVLTGGCANNKALIASLEKIIGVSINTLPENPQIVGALGAALFARKRAGKL